MEDVRPYRGEIRKYLFSPDPVAASMIREIERRVDNEKTSSFDETIYAAGKISSAVGVSLASTDLILGRRKFFNWLSAFAAVTGEGSASFTAGPTLRAWNILPTRYKSTADRFSFALATGRPEPTEDEIKKIISQLKALALRQLGA